MTNAATAEIAAIRAGVKVVLDRKLAAYDAMVCSISEYVGAEKAKVIMAVWSKQKCIKYTGDRYIVKHGGFWDIEALERAYRFGTTGKID
jgi:hypothetical protein